MNNQVDEHLSAENARWNFAGEVPKQFVSHARRSIPFYDEGHELIIKLSDFFVKPDSTCYELGTSTGQLIKQLSKHHKDTVNWIGLEKEADMLIQAKEEIKEYDPGLTNIQLEHADLTHYEFQKSDLVISYYTMQFVPPRYRQEVFNRLYESLNWGGALLVFEKVRGADARFQDILTTLYQDFKLEQGFTPSEILAKTRSLKGVLEPFSTQGNLDLLKRAGFVDIISVFKHLCFEGFLAIK